MPIKYGTTTVNTVNYGSTLVGTVNYGSTKVFPDTITISVSTNDTDWCDVYVSTDKTSPGTATSVTVSPGTKIYFFVKLKINMLLNSQYWNSSWTLISGTALYPNAIYRITGGSLIYKYSYSGHSLVTLNSDDSLAPTSSSTYKFSCRSLKSDYVYPLMINGGPGTNYFEWDVNNDYSDITVILYSWNWELETESEYYDDADSPYTELGPSSAIPMGMSEEYGSNINWLYIETQFYDPQYKINPVIVSIEP